MPIRTTSEWIVTDSKDNATATATKAANANQTHYITGVYYSFSAAVSGKLGTIKKDTTVLGNFYVYNQLAAPFPFPVAVPKGSAATAELAASGAGGTLGAVVMTGFTVVG